MPERLGAQERGHVFDEAILGRDRSMAMPADGQAASMSPGRGRLIPAGEGQFAEERVRSGDIVQIPKPVLKASEMLAVGFRLLFWVETLEEVHRIAQSFYGEAQLMKRGLR